MQNKSGNKFKKYNKFRRNKGFRKHERPKIKIDDEISQLKEKYESINSKNVKFFWDFPLSQKTLQGLKSADYKVPTDIQKESIGLSLQGKDILGAAITGSGKTLAFLIPIIENLYINKWCRDDGVGAIIISPTRELAYQIFETLKKIGLYHDFSAGLIIGGKNLKFERKRMDQCNIVICTPGRLLQHMDENPLFNCSTMQIVVLDEADRCLDMGFEETMNAILENLPTERQTLLFSATQTKSVKDLARLSLKNPVYVAPNEQQAVTPAALQQNYIIANLEDKIAVLWSFLKNHSKQKLIIFLSTCKQVKFIFEMFCKLRPGISLLALYGTLHQDRRVAIYEDFCKKKSCCLFATDIASRGLDFPIVNWVIQLDCPEDVDQYIHRAGRTARHQAKGESLLVLMPSEQEAMLEELESRKVKINQIFVDPKKIFSPKAKMEAYLAANKELKESAQRALVAYVKSVHLMKNKKIFNTQKFDIDTFALSLGLPFTPRVRFLDSLRIKKANKLRATKSQTQNQDIVEESKSDDENSNDDEDVSNIKTESETTDDENDEELQITGAKSQNDVDIRALLGNDSEDEDLFKVKRKDHEINSTDDDDDDEPIEDIEELKKERIKTKTVTKAALAKRVIKKKILPNKKVVYNDEGEQVLDPIKNLQSELGQKYLEEDNDGGIDIEKAKLILQEEDKFDKERFRQYVKSKRLKKKIKAKKAEENADDFGTDSEDDVDLSWLPDPDKIYGPKKDTDDEVNDDSDNYENDSNDDDENENYSNDENDNENYSNDEDDENDSNDYEDEKIHKPPHKLIESSKKRKHKTNNSDEDVIDKKQSSDEEDILIDDEPPSRKKFKKVINKLSIEDAETLALNLLKS